MTTSTTEDATNEPATVRLELSSNAVSIAVGRAVIRRVVTFRDDDAESSFLVAFTEIMANAIDEHERVDVSAPIVVEIEQAAGDLGDVIRVADAGSGLPDDPTAMPPVSDTALQRGRGLALAHAFIEGLAFESSSAGTTVTLPLAGFGIVR